MAAFKCECGREIPDDLVIRLLKENVVLACSGCKKKLSRNALLDEGLRCPTCTSHLKRYHRPINAGMARSLFGLWSLSFHQPDVEWWHHSQFDSGREVHKLKWWGFVEQKPMSVDDEGKKTSSGYWRITDTGRQFAAGYVKVPSRAVVFQKRFEGLEGDPITIREALSTKFNYGQLMTAHETKSLSPTTGELPKKKKAKKLKRPKPVAS